MHCQSGTQIPSGAAQLLKNLEMVFDTQTLTQTLALMPTCKVTSMGPYKLVGTELQIGALKVGVSQTCPAGFSAKDKGPTTAKISFQQNSFVLTVDPTGACPAGDRLVMIMKRKLQ